MKSTLSLKKNHEFRRLYSNGKSAASKYIVIYTRKNYKHTNRLGITVSTKIGGAVQRNRIRRRLKEIYRINEQFLQVGYDIVIVARISARCAEWTNLKSSVVHLLTKLGLFK